MGHRGDVLYKPFFSVVIGCYTTIQIQNKQEAFTHFYTLCVYYVRDEGVPIWSRAQAGSASGVLSGEAIRTCGLTPGLK
jgi:hypothetical protein